MQQDDHQSAQAANSDCSCEEFADNMYALLDAELGDNMCDRLRAHVSHCPSCTEIVDAERHVRELLRRGCAERAPEQLRIRILQQMTIARTTTYRTSL